MTSVKLNLKASKVQADSHPQTRLAVPSTEIVARQEASLGHAVTSQNIHSDWSGKVDKIAAKINNMADAYIVRSVRAGSTI